jgi:tetratricopeptide (TPR) repeat protein
VTLPGAPALVARFRALFADDPRAAFRDWFVLQEHLRDENGDEAAEKARALATDVLDIRETLVFSAKEEEATFLHNLAVFFGSRGPAESLPLSLSLFEESLSTGYPSRDPEAWARLQHNRGNALQNLARSREDLLEALACYERALTVRDATRPIARGVTLHARGLALRTLAEAEPASREERLRSAVSSLEESLSLRSSEGLARGVAETSRALDEARGALAAGC